VAEAAFGMELRRSRQAAALSLRQLAVRVGYDHSYLSQVERGQRPGSVHLAQLCDRALGTGSALATAYERARPGRRPTALATARHSPVLFPAPRLAPTTAPGVAPEHAPVPALQPGPALPASADMLELTRHGLVGSFSQRPAGDEWPAVVTAYATEFPISAPADLLPELSADLELLRTTAAATPPQALAALTGSAARLAALMALTLVCLGRSRAAKRWWRTARDTADQSGDRQACSSVRSWEAISGLAEHRPLPQLLELADEAQVIADRLDWSADALAGRALVLATMGRTGAARKAMRDLRAVAAGLPTEVPSGSSLFGWPSYRLHYVESYVCTALGDTGGAYSAQERAFALCPPDHRRDRAELALHRARCLVRDREVAAGLATAMRALVELPDRCQTEFLYDAARRVLSAVPAEDLGRPAVRDYRELLMRRPYQRR
jgi:hypothetical protein